MTPIHSMPLRAGLRARFRTAIAAVLPTLALLGFAADATAATVTQNASWTINRAGTATKYRVVAYGDSIYAGYNTTLTSVARYAGPTVQSEYLSAAWNADIESIRRTKSGALAKDIYENKVVAERAYMQNSATRVVSIEMCGNDGLQARAAFRNQTGTCNYAVLETALQNCKTYVAASMDYINANAYAGTKLKVISNLFYPGYGAENVQSSCRDASTRATVNVAELMLRRAALMNYWMCEYARQKGFQCADSFAQFMAADSDTNGDGLIDSEALRYVPGDTEASYVDRIMALRATVRDPNGKFVTASSSVDYIQSDDVHPTYTGGNATLLYGSTSGSAAPRYTSFPNGKSPIWNQYGHERLGWATSVFNPTAP